jgi:endoglucanase
MKRSEDPATATRRWTKLALALPLWVACSAHELKPTANEPEGVPDEPADVRDGGARPSAPGRDDSSATRDAGEKPKDDVVPATDASTGGTPVAQHGALHAGRGTLLDASNTPVALRGMSLFWSQWGSAYWSAGAVKTLRNDWGATIVRAAMGVEEGDSYLQHPDVEKARVRAVVDAAIAEGMYVIIDWHDHHAEQHTEQAKAFFTEMADLYGKKPNVLFEVYNEPLATTTWAQVRTYAETITSAIRSRGASSVVLVGSPHWSQDVDIAAQSPLTDTNVAYTLHFYAAQPEHKAQLRAKAQLALEKGASLFASEWGTPNAIAQGSPDLSESKVWLDFLAAKQIGWCNWSLHDKAEPASALKTGAPPAGPWPDASLTISGAFVRAQLRAAK